MMEPSVDILMSVHNGGLFLREQIDSLLAQTFRSWRLLVRDDNSSDDSVAILKEYRSRYPEKIVLITDCDGQLGACQGFGRVLQAAEAKYVMFCDQDDVWLPEKIEKSLREIARLEESAPGRPAMVYTDLKVVDESLRLVSDSFWHYQRINPADNSLKLLILDNVATGCAMIFNRRLKEISGPIPAEAIMHDWWLAMMCSIYGKMAFLRDKTLLYRQHGRNDTGAEDFSVAARSRRFWQSPAAVFRRSSKKAALVRRQASKLLEHTARNPVPDTEMIIPLKHFSEDNGFWLRKWHLVRFGMLSGNRIKALKRLVFF